MSTVRLRDDLGRELLFGRAPARVVSLVPSDTHSVRALGLGDRLVGVTRYCDAPGVPVVGGTKDVDVERVLAQEPELVIANQEENGRVALEALAARVPVLVSLPRRAADGLAHLARLARIFRVEREASVVELVRRGYQALAAPAPASTLDVFVPIWNDPLMTMNADTFGSDMLALAGARNVFGDRLRLYPLAADLGKGEAKDPGERDVRYPRVPMSEVLARAPRAVLLPDEPHPFGESEAAAFRAALPGVHVAFVSGADLFWYGAWTVDALPRLRAKVAEIVAEMA